MTTSNSHSPQISNRRRLGEIVAVVLTASGKFLFMDLLHWRLPFIIVAITGWATYVLMRRKNDPSIMTYWGFRGDNFKQAVLAIIPFAIVATMLCFVVGYFRNTISIGPEVFILLALYPVWGLIQQFLVMSLVAGNLHDAKLSIHKLSILLITATLFGLLHYPSILLMGATFLLALFYGLVFLRVRNVFALGLFHGILATIFYYTILNRDVFAEVFRSFN